ncbi:MAG TPA: group II intron reverse transcriptase/maturase [Geobacteraceae bacterium]|nr:group II intron reverse transcriptase/maturase [Geobacteraceae bacterium]
MYLGKDLTEVRSPHRPLVPDNVGPDQGETTFLRGISIKAKADKQHRFQDLYRYLDADFLWHCWGDLNQDAASGVDGVTAAVYAENLHANIQGLAERLKSKRYRTQQVRRVYIPKENGKNRPLGIPALEDKLVQLACAKLLGAIYESDFLACSYGYRPGRGARDAVQELTFDLQYGVYGYVVEADGQGFFDHLDHTQLLELLSLRIDDRAFLELIRQWLKAGVLERDGEVIYPEAGSPQGGIVSPVLANVYLHHALDLWFEQVVKAHCRGEALLCRYADDWVCAFRYREDAERLFRVLPKRLENFGLRLAPEKTRLLRFSRFHPNRKRRFAFLGFEFYWCPDRQGTPRVMRRTARKKLQAACRRIKTWIRENRHLPGHDFFRGLNRRLRGHYNYFGVRGNSRSLYRFFNWAISCTFKWLNRRGGKRRSFTWGLFSQILDRIPVARPSITEMKQRRVFA